MSLPTFVMGCLPTYAAVGRLAPWLLVLARIVQGFAVGGEFTATMVFLVEHSPPGQAGMQGSWTFFSVMVGVLCGSGVSMLFNYALSDAQLYAWGWRVPFLVSIAGAAVGAYMRRNVHEPPSNQHHYDTHHGHHVGLLSHHHEQQEPEQAQGAGTAPGQGQGLGLGLDLDRLHNHHRQHHNEEGLAPSDSLLQPLELHRLSSSGGPGAGGAGGGLEGDAEAGGGAARVGFSGFARPSGERERLLPLPGYADDGGRLGSHGGGSSDGSGSGGGGVAQPPVRGAGGWAGGQGRGTCTAVGAGGRGQGRWQRLGAWIHTQLLRPPVRAAVGAFTVFTIDFLTAVGEWVVVGCRG